MCIADIILSTRNPSKADQIRVILHDLPVRILTLEEANVAGDAIEDGRTLTQNAFKKAHFVWERTRQWSIADDTGLFIDALNGEPGIRAARWAGDNATTEEILRFTLGKLKDTLPRSRAATFKTVAVVIAPGGVRAAFTGEVKGSILTEPRGAFQPKMPYSSIFVPNGQEKVWAEMTVEEENAISHRGRAFRQVRDFLAETLG